MAYRTRVFIDFNATWANHGFDLKRTCWAEIELDAVMSLMRR